MNILIAADSFIEKYGVQTFCAILGLVISSPIAIFINTGLVSKLGSLSLWEIFIWNRPHGCRGFRYGICG